MIAAFWMEEVLCQATLHRCEIKADELLSFNLVLIVYRVEEKR